MSFENKGRMWSDLHYRCLRQDAGTESRPVIKPASPHNHRDVCVAAFYIFIYVFFFQETSRISSPHTHTHTHTHTHRDAPTAAHLTHSKTTVCVRWLSCFSDTEELLTRKNESGNRNFDGELDRRCKHSQNRHKQRTLPVHLHIQACSLYVCVCVYIYL